MSEVASRNPATGLELMRMPASSADEVVREVERLSAGQSRWAERPTAGRAEVVRRFADLLEADVEHLAATIVAEVGKLRSEAVAEVRSTVAAARWYAARPPRPERAGSAEVIRRPVGVLAVVSPWNVPLVTPAWKWLPALMLGNSIAWKPSELATLTALRASELLHTAGVPSEVFAVLPGDAATGAALCAAGPVGAVHFTGSTTSGREIAAAVAPRFIPYSLEMGGSNPAVVFDDASIDHAADCIAATVASLQGQKCTTTRRVLVQSSVADALTTALGERFESFVMGDPADERTTLGPLITPAAAARAHAAVETALAAGAELAARTPVGRLDGLAPDGFFPATLVVGLDGGDRLRREELFAPVVSIDRFEADRDAWVAANDTPYGLSAAVYSTSIDRQRQAASCLRAGVVAINRRSDHAELEAPFGGLKASGHGRPDGGTYVYDSMSELQAVYAPPVDNMELIA